VVKRITSIICYDKIARSIRAEGTPLFLRFDDAHPFSLWSLRALKEPRARWKKVNAQPTSINL
jgi:hypothetical protein